MPAALTAPARLAGTLLSFAVLTACSPPHRLQVWAPDAVKGRFAAAQYYNDYGCTGDNVAPRIVWHGAPADAKSFAVTIFDPDAPTGHGWWHWLIVDIPASSHELTPGHLPAGVTETMTDFGKTGYGGPCPPPGPDHHYVITVSALKVAKLALPADRTPAAVDAAIKAQSIKQTQIVLMAGR